MMENKHHKCGYDLLLDPQLNKSTGFTEQEKEELGLLGLVPDITESEELQIKRVLLQLEHKKTDLERYIYLANLLDHNETLFYRVTMSDPARFLPIVYDPTIGEACLKYDRIIRHTRGLYLSLSREGKIKDILKNWPHKDIRFICVTNGGRILGLGDLGANGMPIPIGKLQLYTIAAGVPPQHCMPLYLDSGTNNEDLLHDPFYLGRREKRPKTEELYSFVDEFVDAVQELFPLCCIHFEDWTGVDAVRLLERYRDKVCCYNDDIQGTASIVLAGLINAVKIKKEKLSKQKILFVGAGSAGIGIANLIVSAMVKEGISEKEAQQKIALFDVHGLLEKSRKDLFDFQMPYAHDYQKTETLLKAVDLIQPTILIGVSTVGGLFTQEIVEKMAQINEKPTVFALSNPTEHAECTAEQAYRWTEGKAIYAAGVQFPPVKLGKNKIMHPSQANNFYIFPAIGMAIFATQAKRVNDDMFIEAAHAVSDMVTKEQLKDGVLYPSQANINEAEIKTAARVAQLIFEQNLARAPQPENIETFIRNHFYTATY